MPEKKPDYYYAEIPQKNNTITFITDQDSISFDVFYKKEYDFIILLNGRDSCFTRISASYKDLNPSARLNLSAGPDTIPFTLGDARKIYVNAILNGSVLSNVQLDLGAGGMVINKTSIKKVSMNFDDKIILANSDGVNQVQSASKNHLQLENLVWDSVSVAVASNMKSHEDLIIGNTLFKDKILEINYDQRILVVHEILPRQIASYSRHDVILEGGITPHVKVNLTIGDANQTGWALFDTGARTSILNSVDASMAYRIGTQVAGMFGLNEAIIPKLAIGDYRFSGFEYKTRDMGTDGLRITLGNDLLKRFNLILDNKNGYLYMQQNSLANTPYGNDDVYYVVRAITGLVMFLAGVLCYMKIRKI